MMQCEIKVSGDVPRRYERWTKEILGLFGPDITYSAGRRYHLRMPVSRVSLLSEREYENSRSKEQSNSGYSPQLESYAGLENDQSSVDLKSFYEKERVVPLDSSLGHWTPGLSFDSAGRRIEDGFESLIFLCPERIQSYAHRSKRRLPEINPRFLEKYVFKIALTHEIGHHYSLANFSGADVKTIMAYRDLNILEGLANWLSYMHLTQEERWVLAEMAVNQDPSYRHYLYFKHSDLSPLLDCFLADMDYSRAPIALKKVIGGQHNLNGFMMSVESKYDGIAMDWSGKGGVIVAGDSIKGVGTMNRGCFIAPKIEFLIGRFPAKTLIVSNEITHVFDYGKIPDNVMILPKKEKDLTSIIHNNKLKDGGIDLRALLRDLEISAPMIEDLVRMPYQKNQVRGSG